MYLSGDDPEIIAGNFMADFITNVQLKEFSSGIVQGVRLHRAIDEFTDRHPKVAEFNSRLRKTQNKYAPVVTDILIDYFLTTAWQQWHQTPVREFADSIYHILNQYIEIFPEKLKHLAPRMISDDFLLSCSSKERLQKTLFFLSRRAKFENNIQYAHHDLEVHYDVFRSGFQIFFMEAKDNFNR